MLRRTLLATCLIAALPVSSALAGDASLTRIEPRPYYGAVVTVEQGVRVWRALPPTRHMIINPTNAPVSVNITDVRETINHRGMPYGYGGGYAPVPQGYGYGNPGYHSYGAPVGRFVPVHPRHRHGAGNGGLNPLPRHGHNRHHGKFHGKPGGHGKH